MIRQKRRRKLLAKVLAGASIVALALIAVPRTYADTTHSPKKGIGMGNKSQKSAAWAKQIESLHVNWLYDWGSKPPAALPAGIKFVPMVWGYYGKSTDAIFPVLTKEYQEGKILYLLGYNEPDHKDQSNMSVETALKTWHLFEQTGIPLGAPAAANPMGPWEKPFMKALDKRHGRADFMCVHSYGGNNPKAFLVMLGNVHKFYHRPIWITEFAVGDWHAKKNGHNKYSSAQVQAFMKVVLPALDKLPWVQRYAWFPANQSSMALGTSALFKPNGSLTELGKIYAAN